MTDLTHASGDPAFRVAGRPLAAYRPRRVGACQALHTVAEVVGWAGRRIVKDGRLVGDAPDMFVVEGMAGYGAALKLRDRLMREGEAWVVNELFVCGCRSL